jgi:hypothetical protein
MRVDLRVPAGTKCLSFDSRFLSEEYPEFVGDAGAVNGEVVGAQ